MKKEIISLKHARDIFPSKITRARAHDIISKSDNKLLSKTEQVKLHNLAMKIRDGIFGENSDVLIKRNGKKLSITKF